MPSGNFNHKFIPGTGFKKGNTEEKSINWRGDNVGYFALHKWVRKWKGHAKCCENCGKKGKRIGRMWNIEWSNCDHRYRRVLEDYIGMCRSCHKKYDYSLKRKFRGGK